MKVQVSLSGMSLSASPADLLDKGSKVIVRIAKNEW
jgi:hypothetical protein